MTNVYETRLTGTPAHLQSLLRHFADLRDGTHGEVAVSRTEKENLYLKAVDFLQPYARQALEEINRTLLLGEGLVTFSDISRTKGGDLRAIWSLSWPDQKQAAISPVIIEAVYGARFHHPHLRGATVGLWPLNVFSDADAATELPTLRAIVAADLHNLVFQSNFRIIPAIA